MKCTTIGPDEQLHAEVAALVNDIPGLESIRSLRCYPGLDALARFFRANPARIVFVDASNKEEALQLCTAIEYFDPGLQIIAIGRKENPISAGDLMRVGVREYIERPLNRGVLAEALRRRARVLSRVTDESDRRASYFCSFLPAKPGSGTSTLAANVSMALSADRTVKTLLADFDTGSGTVAFRYRLDHPHSVYQAVESADDLDETLWSRLATRMRDLDVLPAEVRSGARMDTAQVTKMLIFLRGIYDAAVFDLSGSLEDHSYEVMQESNSIFLVCTQELDCLHVARKKAQTLRHLGLHDRTRVLVNRYRKDHSLTASHIEDVLGLKVEKVFPNDYKAVEESLASGKNVNPNCGLGKAVREFALQNVLERPTEPAAKKFSFNISMPGFARKRNRSESVPAVKLLTAGDVVIEPVTPVIDLSA